MNYVATADRADVVRAMYEFIDKSKESWVEHEPEPGAAAEDEQLGRARQRVAELEHAHEEMLLKHAKDQGIALELLEAALTQVVQYKELLGRAADALMPYEWGFPDGVQIRQLIAELRKAAQ